MKTMKKVFSFVLCLSLCMSLTVPAMALNESNDRDVTFFVRLDQNSVAVTKFQNTDCSTVILTTERLQIPLMQL